MYKCILIHMKRKKPFVYTNIGFKPDQHRLLKHLAVEERKDLADLVRDAVDLLIDKKCGRKGIPYEQDFISQLGRKRSATVERPYRPEEWSQVDRDLYGPDAHR